MMDNINLEKISPFEPTKPVCPENLEGRVDIIDDYVKYLPSVVDGNPHHFYLYGNRGVGKSSLAHYLLEYAEITYNMVGIHVYNDGIHDIDSLINNIVEELLNKVKNEKWGDKIISLFENHIESIGFLGNSIKFKPKNPSVTEDIKHSFSDFLVNMINNFENKNGLFIVIDDVNGLSKTPDFANWYESFADTISTTYKVPIPLVMMLTSHPKVSKLLYGHNPSFNRIFIYREIDFLKRDDVENFFNKRFHSYGINIEKNALNSMVEFSAGSPVMMQNIGDGIFWMNNDNVISKKIALDGIKNAGNEIKLRYLKSSLDEFKLTDDDLNILRKLGRDFINNAYSKYSFTFENISQSLSKFDEEVFNEFIKKALNNGIIEVKSESNREFVFTNDLFPIYFSI